MFKDRCPGYYLSALTVRKYHSLPLKTEPHDRANIPVIGKQAWLFIQVSQFYKHHLHLVDEVIPGSKMLCSSHEVILPSRWFSWDSSPRQFHSARCCPVTHSLSMGLLQVCGLDKFCFVVVGLSKIPEKSNLKNGKPYFGSPS